MPEAISMELRPPDLTNLHPATDEDTGRGHLSHSSIGTQLACLKRYEWKYVHGLEKIDRPEALSLGSAFQKAIEHNDPQAGADALASERKTFDQADEDKLIVDMAIVWSMANGYMKRWPRRDHVAEYEYRIRLRSPYTGHYSRTFDLVGAADGVDDHGGYLELTENKTASRIDEVSVKKVKLDRQVSLEAYALWRVTGKPVRAIRYRFSKKPSIKQRQKESVSEFVERLKNDYLERPDFYFVEEMTLRDSSDLLTIEAELWSFAEQRRHAAQGLVYPRNTASCGDFGGCPYLDLCLKGDEALPLYTKRER